jgi:hypothetical protein
MWEDKARCALLHGASVTADKNVRRDATRDGVRNEQGVNQQYGVHVGATMITNIMDSKKSKDGRSELKSACLAQMTRYL